MKSLLIKSTATLLVLLGGSTINELIFPHQSIILAESVWQKFSSAQGRFSILMPGKPKQSTQIVNTQFGNIRLRVFLVERKKENVEFVVTYSDFADQYIQLLNRSNLTEQALENAKIIALQNAKGTLLSERSINLGKYLGKELRYRRPGNKIVNHRMYLVDKRLYQIVVQTAPEQEKSLTNTIEGFFNSFTLLRK